MARGAVVFRRVVLLVEGGMRNIGMLDDLLNKRSTAVLVVAGVGAVQKLPVPIPRMR